jgi:putative flippase GtrA
MGKHSFPSILLSLPIYPAVRGIAVQFSKFMGVGAVGTLMHYLVLVVLVELVGIEVLIGSSLGALVGALVNYVLNYRFTFASSKRHHEALTKFLAVAGTSFLLNGAVMSLFSYHLGWPYLSAQVMSTLLMLIWNFTANRVWTFAE